MDDSADSSGGTLLAEVILDLPIWSLNRPFTYRVPDALASAVRLGSVVRVPLRGRRVRGWVVARSPGDPGAAIELAGVCGAAAVFDAPLLAMARAMARRYVAPLSSFLHLLTPPQMGRRMLRRAAPPEPEGEARTPRAVAGTRTLRRLGPREDAVGIYAEAISGVLAAGRGAIVVVPELREGSVVLEGLQAVFNDAAAVVHSGQEPARRSKALWSVAKGDRPVVLGGRAAVFAPAFDVGLIIVHAESDWTLREQAAPYYDAREVAECRATLCGASLLLAAEGPSLRTLYRATAATPPWDLVEPSPVTMRRSWPVVTTQRGLARRALAAVAGGGEPGSRCLVLVPRAEASPSGPGPAEVAGYLHQALPLLRVRRADPGALDSPADLAAALDADVVVATEGALADVRRPAIARAVALGVDALIHRPTGRAAEQGFATLWELACLVSKGAPDGAAGSTGRLLLETTSPQHHCIEAVVQADYHLFARQELADRRESEAAPYVCLIRVRIAQARASTEDRLFAVPGQRGGLDELLERLGALPGTELLGPIPGPGGPEVLLKVADIEQVLDPLAAIVASAPQRLLVETDPREW